MLIVMCLNILTYSRTIEFVGAISAVDFSVTLPFEGYALPVSALELAGGAIVEMAIQLVCSVGAVIFVVAS